MIRHDERIEHLINRKLDGELTEDERLELDRALIRSPEHRRMLEESESVDSLCAEVLRNEVGSHAKATVVASNPFPSIPLRSRSRRIWWLIPAALAACLVWVVYPARMLTPDQSPLVFGVGNKIGRGNADAPGNGSPVVMHRNNLQRVGMRPSVTDGRRNTGLYRVLGRDGRLYLIQLDHLRAVRRPVPRSIEPGSLGDL